MINQALPGQPVQSTPSLTAAPRKPTVVIYNCKHCKTGRRVEYPHRNAYGHHFRKDGDRAVQAGIWSIFNGMAKPRTDASCIVVEQKTEHGPYYRIFGGDPLGLCDGCQRAMTYGTLQGTRNEAVRCDARCTGARGHSCDCSCDGENHGSAWAVGSPKFRQLVEG